MTERSRSASPDRRDSDIPAKKSKSGGFKWKDKGRAGDNPNRDTSERRHREYRDRSPRRDPGRRRHDEDSFRGDGRRGDERSRAPQDEARNQHRDRSPRRERKEHNDYNSDRRQPRHKEEHSRRDKDAVAGAKSAGKTDSKRAKAIPTGPMIVVNVNDRLGTKAAIPCLPSDSVKAFKAIVAAHIGRQPHEIMLKRQGERPFKDQLSLEDYGVSNGVQLDLEIDTGD